MRRAKHFWNLFYGWHAVPKTEKTDILDENGKPVLRALLGFNKAWSHAPGAILMSAPKGTKQEGACYIVWSNHSLRKITHRVYELLAKVPPAKRVAILKNHVSGVDVGSDTRRVSEHSTLATPPAQTPLAV